MGAVRSASWQQEVNDYVRAFSGAFLFGVPLLFTMEMWWIGTYADLRKLLLFLALAFVANQGLAYFSGFKQGRTVGHSIEQAIEAVAVGIIASTAVLLVLNRIGPGEPLDSILGKVIIQAVPLSIGASTANSVFGSEGRGRQVEPDPTHGPWHATLNDLGATMAGGIFIGFSIAPTEEIPMLAAQLDYAHELALIGLSLLLTYAIVFESGFDPQHVSHRAPGPFQRPITETIMAYVVSLLVTLVTLYLFNQVKASDPLAFSLSQVLVLGLPVSIGGAAGRLVI